MIKLLGDPHLGKQFIHNVPLHRRGDHEKIVWETFEERLRPDGADTHVCMGDLFDKAVVPYAVVWRAATAYKSAARQHRKTTFVVLQGNHDASRDLEAISAFDIFKALVAGYNNILVVDDSRIYEDCVFFGWDPYHSAAEIVEAAGLDLLYTKGMTAFGHWDVDPRSDPFNLIPTAQLAAAGISKAYTGHDHTRRTLTRDGVDVVVVGSMLPYSHGEDPDGTTYVTLTLNEARTIFPGLLYEKCVRVMLAPGEVFDLEIDCLQLQVERMGGDADEQLEVELGEFDLTNLFEASMTDGDVPEHIKTEVRAEWSKNFTTKQ